MFEIFFIINASFLYEENTIIVESKAWSIKFLLLHFNSRLDAAPMLIAIAGYTGSMYHAIFVFAILYNTNGTAIHKNMSK
jgi:hypothetical protein